METEKRNEETTQKQSERNFYDDNIFDVHSVEDLKESMTVNLLAKEKDIYLFELGGDFWKYEKEQGVLRQYPDYVSMLSGDNEVLAYSSDGETSLGTAVKTAIDNESSFEAMPEFSLKNRKNYILNNNGTVDGAIKLPIRISEKQQKKAEKIDESLNQAIKSVDVQETKPMLDLLKLALKSLSLFFLFSKKDNVEYEKEKLIKKIVEGLDNNTIDINKILADGELLRDIPELKSVLAKYSESTLNLKFQDKNEAISQIIGDKDVINVADKLSEDKIFREQLAENFSIKLTKELDKVMPQGYDDKMINKFSKSGVEDPLEYSKGLLLNNLEELYMDDKKINSQEYGIAVAYMAQMVNPDENKNLLVECLAKNELENSNPNILDALEKIVSKCIKNQLAIGQETKHQL